VITRLGQLTAPLMHFYQSRAPREQRVLFFGVIGLVLMLLYALVYEPINDRLEQEQQRVERLSEEARLVAQAAVLAEQRLSFAEQQQQLRANLDDALLAVMQVDEQAGEIKWTLTAERFAVILHILERAHAAGLLLTGLDVVAAEDRVDATVVMSHE